MFSAIFARLNQFKEMATESRLIGKGPIAKIKKYINSPYPHNIPHFILNKQCGLSRQHSASTDDPQCR